MKTEEQRLAYNARMRAWNANNRDKVREAQKRFRDANPRKVKANLLRKYGITLEQFEAMLKDQGNACKICKTSTPGGKGTFHVDHCHKTGVVRGLLCHHCNALLGHAKDQVTILEEAIRYLKVQ